ncbi:hypothetical protein VTK73DRAFT_5421 [Phialemonium thermophilum]|uniref:SAC domain-containing protein n=1 Tax=Phialemonium thermophilum TaxID=223376 RepID=A0ABR3V1Y7_9PEZI
MEQKRLMGLSDSTPPEQQQRRASTSASKKAAAPEKAADVAEAAASGGSAIEEDRATPAAGGLLPKLLRTTQILFGSSRSFFFSYEYDITRSLANSSRAAPSSSPVPLHRQVDPMYFWNRHILQPFVDAGVDSLALPLMQGFVGQRSFVVDSQPPQVDDDAKDSVELSNFRRPSGDDESATGSRPSPPPPPPLRDGKAGLRYLRRGVDDEGFVANAVETEQLLSPSHPAGPGDQVFSFVQVRGSIPLFFTQSPYSLRPAPVLRHSPEANYLALTRHFERLERQYGSLQVVNLVEKHGIEAPLGAAFEANVRKLNEEAREKAKAAAATDTATAGGPGDKEGRAAAAAGGGGEEEEGDKSDASGNEDRVPPSPHGSRPLAARPRRRRTGG